jgi:hypothetical protein
MRTTLPALLLALTACDTAPPQRILVQAGDTHVTVEDTVTVESGCCCCETDCCEEPCDDDTGGGSDGADGGDGTDGGDDGGDGPCDDISVPTPYTFGTREDCQADGADAPDLFILEGSSYCWDCDNDALTIYLVVGNQGLVDSGPTELAFTESGVEVVRFSVDPVASGSSVVVGPMVIDTTSWSGTLDAAIDIDNTENECDESNNLGSYNGLSWPNACE